MKFTVVVPVHNTAEHLERCMAALRAQDYPRDQFEILMVDNNSTDGSAGILGRADGVRALAEPKQGSYAARNRAVREAGGDVLAFTDSDCAPAAGWLRAIERAFEAPRVNVVLGCRRPGRDAGLIRLLADYENKKDEHVFASHAAESYYGFTNNMGVRRATFEQYGPFVERPRGADTIFVRRVAEGEGCEAVAYAPAMRIGHAEMDGVRAYYRKMFTYGRSRQLYRHIVKTRPLTSAERLEAFRATVRDGGYSWASAAALACLLAGGMAAWSLGSHSRRWSKAPVR
ncbi:MAG: glycosyltransferase family 2 protein [Vicinamibacterales bacterium]|jgi:glycosyltransferase involved in cell wall biosynthesis|nr:glycosyltransferase family 2 protein [Vicinamibacterales bacterium]